MPRSLTSTTAAAQPVRSAIAPRDAAGIVRTEDDRRARTAGVFPCIRRSPRWRRRARGRSLRGVRKPPEDVTHCRVHHAPGADAVDHQLQRLGLIDRREAPGAPRQAHTRAGSAAPAPRRPRVLARSRRRSPRRRRRRLGCAMPRTASATIRAMSSPATTSGVRTGIATSAPVRRAFVRHGACGTGVPTVRTTIGLSHHFRDTSQPFEDFLEVIHARTLEEHDDRPRARGAASQRTASALRSKRTSRSPECPLRARRVRVRSRRRRRREARLRSARAAAAPTRSCIAPDPSPSSAMLARTAMRRSARSCAKASSVASVPAIDALYASKMRSRSPTRVRS